MAKDQTSLDFDAVNSILKINDGSQLRDLSPHISNIDFGPRWGEKDLTTYGSSGKKPAESRDESIFTVDFIWNQYTDTGVEEVVGAMWYAKATRAFEYYPAGTTSGNTKWSGNCKCMEYSLMGKVEDSIRVRARFAVHDGLTRGTAV